MGLELVDRLRKGQVESQSRTQFVVVRGLSGMLRQIAQILCGVRGHFYLMHFEPHRLSLQCAWCAHESHGWQVGVVSRKERRRAPRTVEHTMPLLARSGRQRVA